MLSLQHITKYYQAGGTKNYVLNDISLDVDQGEFISIMGPSGSGKSTLLNVIGMLDEPTEGYHYFAGEAVHQLKEKQRAALYKKYIGFVFQAYHLIDELTVYENIETPLIYQDVKSSERKAMVADILDRFQIVGILLADPLVSQDVFGSLQHVRTAKDERLDRAVHFDDEKLPAGIPQQFDEVRQVVDFRAVDATNDAEGRRRVAFGGLVGNQVSEGDKLFAREGRLIQ